MINEWSVAFPVTLSYSVWLAGAAPDKENISCEYLCCLLRAKAQCLRKVIHLYTCTERHTSAEREEKRNVNISQLCSALLLTSLTCSDSASCCPPYINSFSSPVMPSLILYNQTFLLLHMALRERVARVQNCEGRCNITVNSSDNKRRSRQCVGGGSGSHMR